MEETRILATIDETQLPAEKEVCEKHKEGLETKKHTDLFCMEDQTPICTVCRNSWDHASHTVIPQKQEARKTNQVNQNRYCELCPEVGKEPVQETLGLYFPDLLDDYLHQVQQTICTVSLQG